MNKKTISTLVVIIVFIIAAGAWYISRNEKSAIVQRPNKDELMIWGNVASFSSAGVSVASGQDKLDCAYTPQTLFRTFSFESVVPEVGDIIIVDRDRETSEISSVTLRRGVDLASVQEGGPFSSSTAIGQVTSVSGMDIVARDYDGKSVPIDLAGVEGLVADVAGESDIVSLNARANLVCKKGSDGLWTALTVSIYK